MIKLDIRIMATPKRKEMAEKLCEQLKLPLENIIWDDRPNGGLPRYTAQKAWLFPFENDITHRMVIQDDVEICNDFLWAVKQCINLRPNEVWTFFSWLKDEREGYFRQIPTCFLSGQSIVIPKNKISCCWDWINKNISSELQDDDSCLALWLYNNNLPLFTTIPSLCQNSLNSCIKNKTPPFSPTFSKNVISLKDWENKEILFLAK